MVQRIERVRGGQWSAVQAGADVRGRRSSGGGVITSTRGECIHGGPFHGYRASGSYRQMDRYARHHRAGFPFLQSIATNTNNESIRLAARLRHHPHHPHQQ